MSAANRRRRQERRAIRRAIREWTLLFAPVLMANTRTVIGHYTAR